jgi:hypothetical protein
MVVLPSFPAGSPPSNSTRTSEEDSPLSFHDHWAGLTKGIDIGNNASVEKFAGQYGVNRGQVGADGVYHTMDNTELLAAAKSKYLPQFQANQPAGGANSSAPAGRSATLSLQPYMTSPPTSTAGASLAQAPLAAPTLSLHPYDATSHPASASTGKGEASALQPFSTATTDTVPAKPPYSSSTAASNGTSPSWPGQSATVSPRTSGSVPATPAETYSSNFSNTERLARSLATSIPSLDGPSYIRTPNPTVNINAENAARGDRDAYAAHAFNQWYSGLPADEAAKFQGNPSTNGMLRIVTNDGIVHDGSGPRDADNLAGIQKENARRHFMMNVLPGDAGYQQADANYKSARDFRIKGPSLQPYSVPPEDPQVGLDREKFAASNKLANDRLDFDKQNSHDKLDLDRQKLTQDGARSMAQGLATSIGRFGNWVTQQRQISAQNAKTSAEAEKSRRELAVKVQAERNKILTAPSLTDTERETALSQFDQHMGLADGQAGAAGAGRGATAPAQVTTSPTMGLPKAPAGGGAPPDNVVEQFVVAAGNDPVAAKALARAHGWTVR